MPQHFDEIGYWSELKLEILKEYAAAYSRILAAQSAPPLRHAYIEGFAGAGIHLSKSSGEFVLGSPLNALRVQPPFREYHLIDIRLDRIEGLREMIGPRVGRDVYLYAGDCNTVLLEKVFPRIRYENYCRALCILDPYGLHLDWKVMEAAGRSRAVDLFLNFPIHDMNRNVLRHDPDSVDPIQRARMTTYCGDESWRDFAYGKNLFGDPDKLSNEAVVDWFRKRLRTAAGFKRVIQPLPMRNSRGAVVYYLFFASQKDTAEHIVKGIFRKYETRGAA